MSKKIIIGNTVGTPLNPQMFAASGDSAYEIAVKHGFKGTEEEWLASLKGADGKDGADGTPVEVNTPEDGEADLVVLKVDGTVYNIPKATDSAVPHPIAVTPKGIVYYDKDTNISSFVTIGDGLKLEGNKISVKSDFVADKINSAITEVLNTEVEV